MFKLSELNGRIPDRSIGIHELVQCMHLLVPPTHQSLTGKGFVTCVFGGIRVISVWGMALSFHCWAKARIIVSLALP